MQGCDGTTAESDLLEPPAIILDVLHVLGVHGMELAVGRILVE